MNPEQQPQVPKPVRGPQSAAEIAKLQAEWDAKLSNEGLSPELSPEESEHAPSAAFLAALERMRMYYLTTSTAEFNAHRRAADEASAELDIEERDKFDDDLVRSIEDEVGQLQGAAQETVRDIVKTRPSIVGRPDAIVNAGMQILKLRYPDYGKELLRTALSQAASAGLN